VFIKRTVKKIFEFFKKNLREKTDKFSKKKNSKIKKPLNFKIQKAVKNLNCKKPLNFSKHFSINFMLQTLKLTNH